MKKLFLVLLAVCLLAGCGQSPEPEQTQVTTLPTEPPVVKLVDTNHPITGETGGAVRVFLPGFECVQVCPMGSRLLLVSADNRFLAMDPEEGKVLAEMEGSQDRTGWDVGPTGLVCYDAKNAQITSYNPQLQESTRLSLQEAIEGIPIVNMAGRQVYYCVGQDIRALDLDTGISRLVKSQSYTTLRLHSSLFDGAVLCCVNAEDDGTKTYISAETGQTLAEDDSLESLHTFGDMYFATRSDGLVRQNIFGKLDEQAQSLEVDTREKLVLPVMETNGAIVGQLQDDGLLEMEYYDLEKGQRLAQVEITGVEQVISVMGMEDGVWLLMDAQGQRILCHWDLQATAVSDSQVYTDVLHTAINPDLEAIALCRERADKLGEQYGVKIFLWEDTLDQTGEHIFSTEYQPLHIELGLEALEKALAMFPEGFLDKTLKSGDICFSFLRSIDGDTESVQYWAGGDCRVGLTCLSDVTVEALRGIGCAVDSHVLGNSRDLDNWSKLNPSGFKYDYSYSLNDHRQEGLEYLEGENRAFVDIESMSFPHQDRSRVLTAAMLPGNEEVFASKTMQKKLKALCDGIREAYDWEKSDQVFLWEQYLQK